MKITICGSMSFYKEMKDLEKSLCEKGYEVRVPLLRIEVEEAGKSRKISIRSLIESSGGIDSFPYNDPIWDEKSNAINDHFKKVEWADAIIIVNHTKHDVAGYVGGNTLMEMAIAKYLGKKIFLLFPVSSELSYKEEILGMRPMILDGDLSVIEEGSPVALANS